jgi:MFS family permease
MSDFGVTSKTQQALSYLRIYPWIGSWPPIFGLISEQYGIIFISTFFLVIIFTLACALTPDWPAFLIFRVLTGIFASSPTVGLYADMYDDFVARGRVMALIVGSLLSHDICSFSFLFLFFSNLFYSGLRNTTV